MGNILERSGIAADLYAMMQKWLGGLNGGLAVGTIFVCTIFAALVGVSGADPLNLIGILTPGDRVPAVAANRIVYRDGVPVAARVAGAVTYYHLGPDGQPASDDQREAVLKALRG